MTRTGAKLAQITVLWLLIACVEVLLSLTLSGGSGSHPVSGFDRMAVLAYDLVLIIPFLLLLILPALWLGQAAGRSGWPGAFVLLLQVLVVWFFLLAYTAHWATFYTTGQFLSIEGFQFWLEQPVQLFYWINRSLTAAALALTLLAALLIVKALPALVAGKPRRQQRLLRLGTGLSIALLLISAISELLIHGAPVPALETLQLGEIRKARHYRSRRDYLTGPFAFAASSRRGSLASAGQFPPDSRIPLIRRPIVPMSDYLTRVDPARFHRFNVILILVESLRADQLLVYGASRDVMPTVNLLARESQVFLNHYTQASHSNYADIGPISSQYPLRSPQAHSYPENPPYPRVLIYDVLKAAGYQTAIFSSQNEYWGQMINYLNTGSLDTLFHPETFDGPTYVMLEDFGFADWVKKTRHAGSIDDRYTTSAAMDWIEQRKDQPFFISMNFQNSHVPYVIPSDFPRPFGPAKIDFDIYFGVFPKERVTDVKNIYADSLYYIDTQIARLFDFLKKEELWNQTIVILSGDTGQAFYEHGFAAHGKDLYNEVMRVPLLFRVPDRSPATYRYPAQHVDVPPTLFHALGLPVHPAFQGLDLFEEPFNAERSIYLTVQTPLAYQHALVKNGFKLIFDELAGDYLLFDQQRDPGEMKDLATDQPQRVQEMAGRLHRWYQEQIEYYRDADRQKSEYPPVLVDASMRH